MHQKPSLGSQNDETAKAKQISVPTDVRLKHEGHEDATKSTFATEALAGDSNQKIEVEFAVQRFGCRGSLRGIFVPFVAQMHFIQV